MIRSLACLAALLLGVPASPAEAALITGTWRVTAEFSPIAPITRAEIVFSISFDDARDTRFSTSGIAILASDLPLASAPSWRYQRAGDFLVIGGSQGGPELIFSGTADFFLALSGLATTPRATNLNYSTVSVPNGGFGATRLEIATVVPEPAAAAIFGGALAALVRAGRRRRPE